MIWVASYVLDFHCSWVLFASEPDDGFNKTFREGQGARHKQKHTENKHTMNTHMQEQRQTERQSSNSCDRSLIIDLTVSCKIIPYFYFKQKKITYFILAFVISSK